MKVLRRGFSAYKAAFSRSVSMPDEYWAEKASDIAWDRPFSTVLDSSKSPLLRWFPEGRLNMCFNCLDRHVLAGNGDEWALIYDSPVTNRIVHYTYDELLEEVKRFAGVLAFRHGVQVGDRVVIYMPMVPEALVAMLACARLGATHSVVFGGFAAKELASRIIDSAPKVIVTASCGIEPSRVIPYKPLVDQALEISASSGLKDADKIHCIIYNRPGQSVPMTMRPHLDFDFYREMANCKNHDSVASVMSNHPLYILYTSGTTGAPKGVVRDTGGYAVALNTVFDQLYGIGKQDVMWAASDIGWVVGHTCITYGPLLRGATTVLYEGKPVGTPDAGAWWRVIATHEVKCMFAAPTSIRAIKKEDPKGKLMKMYNLTSLKHMSIAGERCDPTTLHWLESHLTPGTLLNDHWWQTESGWPIVGNFAGLEQFAVKPGSATKPVPGWDVHILGDDKKSVTVPRTLGKICVKLPTPPGFMQTLWRNDAAFVEKYMKDMPGYYLTGDEGFYDEDGYFHIMARIDDVINTAGHRLSTGQLEEIVGNHDDVAECAVIGVKDAVKGEVPVAIVVPKTGVTSDTIEQEVVKKVRDDIGAVASLKTVVIVNRLPKTRSGKILRNVLKKMAEKQPYTVPSTIEIPEVLDEVKSAMEMRGLGREVNIKFEEDLGTAVTGSSAAERV